MRLIAILSGLCWGTGSIGSPGNQMSKPDRTGFFWQAIRDSITIPYGKTQTAITVAMSIPDEAFGSLSVSDNTARPKEWMGDDKNVGDNIDRFLTHVRKQEAFYDSLGVPCSRVTTDTDGHKRLRPRQWVNPQATDDASKKDNLDTEYVALSREVPADQLEKATAYKMVVSKRQGVEMISVPQAEVAALEAQGWKVYPPLDIGNRYRDCRDVGHPVDVLSYDQPAADTTRYLEHGNNFISSAMTKNNWHAGQLIGPNGSDPAVIAKSMSFAPPDSHNDVSERRSATSTGHILQYRRPAGVCLGWGGYDEHTHWQSFGRRVTKDMVEKRDWPDDQLAPVSVVNESGEVVDVVTIPFKREDLPSQPQKPVTLYDRLNNSG
ncbi:hypothetical protein LZ30DRAFT_690158 [Colletotrichum cereale]|nr:hypothetical protein LZ30DRAFT_690158 [Colletotrichum cereale]